MASRDAETKSFWIATLGSHRTNIAAIILGTFLIIADGFFVLFSATKIDLFEIVAVFVGGMGIVSAVKLLIVACDPNLSQTYGGETGSMVFLGGLVLAIVSIGGVIQLIVR